MYCHVTVLSCDLRNYELCVILILSHPRFVTGIEFREGSLLIGPKCNLQAKAGILTVPNCNIAGTTTGPILSCV